MRQSKCNHPDGKACHKCWPPKPKNPKTAISIFCHISKVKDKYYVAIDGNPHELDEFGISNDQFAEIGDNFEKVVQKALVIKQQTLDQDKWFEDMYGTNDPDKLRDMLSRILTDIGDTYHKVKLDNDIKEWNLKNLRWERHKRELGKK